MDSRYWVQRRSLSLEEFVACLSAVVDPRHENSRTGLWALTSRRPQARRDALPRPCAADDMVDELKPLATPVEHDMQFRIGELACPQVCHLSRDYGPVDRLLEPIA